jgi:hypothetical protein
MIKENEHIINRIIQKFSYAITEFDIISWLDNFEREDWKKALIVLESFEYYSTLEIIKEFETSLIQLLKDFPNGNIYFIPIGRIGKSGSAMIYYLKKTPSFAKKRIKIIEKEEFNTLNDKSNIILVDDFSGSGNTIIEFLQIIKPKLPKNYNISALTVAYMQKAKLTLEKINCPIYGNLRTSAFMKRGSVFGYYPRMRAIREFCFKYGNLIYPLDNYSNNKTKLHPLGYANSQVLIGFEHSIPNNSLPIIWADKNWTPIFPRRGRLIIDKVNRIKKNEKYWSSIFYKLGLNEGLYSIEERYNKQTLQILSLIRLTRKSKSRLSICSHLGINSSELDKIIDKGIEKGLFSESGDLTKQGIKIYEEINKKAKFINHKKELIIEEDILYIPKTFRGSS